MRAFPLPYFIEISRRTHNTTQYNEYSVEASCLPWLHCTVGTESPWSFPEDTPILTQWHRDITKTFLLPCFTRLTPSFSPLGSIKESPCRAAEWRQSGAPGRHPPAPTLHIHYGCWGAGSNVTHREPLYFLDWIDIWSGALNFDIIFHSKNVDVSFFNEELLFKHIWVF